MSSKYFLKQRLMRREGLFYTLQITLISDSRRQVNSHCFCMPLLVFITSIEVYGDNPALNRYVVGKRRNLLIAFSGNLRFFFWHYTGSLFLEVINSHCSFSRKCLPNTRVKQMHKRCSSRQPYLVCNGSAYCVFLILSQEY